MGHADVDCFHLAAHYTYRPVFSWFQNFKQQQLSSLPRYPKRIESTKFLPIFESIHLFRRYWLLSIHNRIAMQPLPDFDLASDFFYDDRAANSAPDSLGIEASIGDPTLNAWPWWSHGAAHKIAKVIQDEQYQLLVAVQPRDNGTTGEQSMLIRAMEALGTDARSMAPRTSQVLESAQKLITTLSRPSFSNAANEPGRKDPQIWLARFCNPEASMSAGEARIKMSMVGRPLPQRVRQVLWMAQRHNSHRNFREAQLCFDREREKTSGGHHNYTLQLGLYRLIESLREIEPTATPSPCEVRGLAETYVVGKLAPTVTAGEASDINAALSPAPAKASSNVIPLSAARLNA